jgi:hypothetical protein
MRTILRFAIAVGLLFTLLPLGAGAGEVNNWREEANYPAQITAIPIGSNKLTRNNAVRIGAWTVSFTGRPVIASYTTNTEAYGPCTMISTYNSEADMGLVCSNPVVGSVPCAFSAALNAECTFVDNTRGPRCYFLIRGNSTILNIPCPSSLSLK